MDPVALAEYIARYAVVAARASDFMASPTEVAEMHSASSTLAQALYRDTGRLFWFDRSLFHAERVRVAREAAR